MKVQWVVLGLFLMLTSGVGGGVGTGVSDGGVPPSFFITEEGAQNCIIVVGEHASASDIVETSRLATAIGELSSRRREIPVIEEVSVSHEDVSAGTCITETPAELDTLWYFDDFGVYGNGNGRFDAWETHEEIALFIEDFPELDPLTHTYRGDGYLDFSTIYRIDNVRSPPLFWVDSYREGVRGQPVTGLHEQERVTFLIVDPFFAYYGYVPQVHFFGKTYPVLYIDSAMLITGTPHLEYVYVYKDEPVKRGPFTMTVKDVDTDHNKAYFQVTGSQFREEFWMVLNPEHGFSAFIQKKGEFVEMDLNNDGIIEYVNKEIVGYSELDVWGHSLFYSQKATYQIPDLVIDGIKTFIGEKIGVYVALYWVEDMEIWGEKECCDPFVHHPQEYSFQIRPDTVVVRSTQDAYVDQAFPLSNFGGGSFLRVRSFLNANARAYVQVDLPLLPSHALITRATLRLVPVSLPTPPRVYTISRVTASWSETGITWANQPGAVLTGTQVNYFMEWDVTSDVRAFYSGTPNYGWRIADQTENAAASAEAVFWAEESSLASVVPQLIVEYTYDCNFLIETIPHTPNWINTYYDDVDGNGADRVYEIDIGLCEPVETVCEPLFFEGPNYLYSVNFTDTSFLTGVDFTVTQKRRVGTYTVKEPHVLAWELIKLDCETSEEDARYNWILIGQNAWVQKLVDGKVMPDDGSSPAWFLDKCGYKMYSDPFAFGNKVMVVAGKTSAETQKAIQMLVEDIKKIRK